MPMTRHRHTLAAVLVAFVALAGLALSRADARAGATNPIVQRALRDLGTYQGECWPWVRRVVLEAVGREMGFDYREGFLQAGAVEVPLTEAGPGDIIQVARDGWTSPDADYPGLHTAIVIKSNGNGTFDAIDSNQLWDGVVRLRPGYDPSAQAAAAGLKARAYRFATGGTTVSTPPSAGPSTLKPGDAARVNTPGDCLRLRASPGGDIITCLAHGARVTVIEGPVERLGAAWYLVSSPVGDGWMAGQFLQREPGGPGANPSAQGPTRPLMQYRAVVPLAAAD